MDPVGTAADGAPSSKGELPEKKDKPKRPGGTKNLEKEVNAAERAVASAEEKKAIHDGMQEILADDDLLAPDPSKPSALKSFLLGAVIIMPHRK